MAACALAPVYHVALDICGALHVGVCQEGRDLHAAIVLELICTQQQRGCKQGLGMQQRGTDGPKGVFSDGADWRGGFCGERAAHCPGALVGTGFRV
jgi:hypothetical protein